MSQQDTYNNKLETFNGMLERGKYNLGGMFQEGAKWGMDLVMQLDSASGGLVGMGNCISRIRHTNNRHHNGIRSNGNRYKSHQRPRIHKMV